MNNTNNGGSIKIDEKLLEDFMDQVRQAKRGVEEKKFRAKSPLPGFVFLKKIPRSEHKQEGVMLLLIIQGLGEGCWRCCKMSCYTWLAGIYDLFLDPEDWQGGYAVIIESWNTMILHEEDIGNEFIATIPDKWLKSLSSLHKAYLENSDIPDELLDCIGNPESTSEKGIFHEEEQLSMERLRMHCHEGWQGSLVWDHVAEGVKVVIDGTKKIISISGSGLDRLKEILLPDPLPGLGTVSGAFGSRAIPIPVMVWAFATRGATTGNKLSEGELDTKEYLIEEFPLIPNDFLSMRNKALKIKFKKTEPKVSDKPATTVLLRGRKVSPADVEWQSWTSDEAVLLIKNCDIKGKKQGKADTLLEIHYKGDNLHINILPPTDAA